MRMIAPLLLLLCLVRTASGQAQAAFGPEQFCRIVNCTEKMKTIVDDYMASGELTDLSASPLVASGECFHRNPAYDPEHAHHGVALMDSSSGKPTYQGLFSFFAESDPWEEMTADQVKEAVEKGGSTPHPMETGPQDHTVVFESPTARLNYWFRSIPEINQVLLLSQWTFKDSPPQYIFCRLHKH